MPFLLFLCKNPLNIVKRKIDFAFSFFSCGAFTFTYYQPLVNTATTTIKIITASSQCKKYIFIVCYALPSPHLSSSPPGAVQKQHVSIYFCRKLSRFLFLFQCSAITVAATIAKKETCNAVLFIRLLSSSWSF